MTDKPKTMKGKLFSVPAKNSVEKCDVPASSKKSTIKKPDSLKLVEDKKSGQQNQTIRKGKSKQAAKVIPKSLTEEEYTEIFSSAINPTLDEEPPKSTERLQCGSSEFPTPAPASPDLSISVTKDCEYEFCDIEIDLPIDQWNDRPVKAVCQDTFPLSNKREGKEEHSSKPQKQREEIIPRSLKKKRQSKMKDLHKTDMPTTVKTKVKHSLVKKREKDSEEEEEEESGTWIQCSITDCSKWRYVPDISDPMNVPDHWDCSMNSDKSRNTCDAPEVQYDDSEHIMTKYTLGSLVWVKMDGFPWWPAMIDSDPDYGTYFELPTAASMIPYLYHATFLDERVSRSWVRSHLIMPYDHRSAPLKVTVKSRSCKKDLQAAITIADKASKLSLQERLDKYSFSKRFSKSMPKVMSGTDKKRKTKKEMGSVAREILSSPNAMMRELEIAIEKCRHSDDSDFSEGDHEYFTKKSRRQEQRRHNTPELNNTSKQKAKDFSKSLQESDCECGSRTAENWEDKQQGGLKFDPDVFTMELKSSENGLEDSQPEGSRKPHRGSDDGDCKNDGESQSNTVSLDNEMNTSTRMTKTLEECLEHKSKFKRKESNKSAKFLQNISMSKNKRRKPDVKTKRSENIEKEVIGKTTSRKDVDKQDDSGKENRDPNDSGLLDDEQKSQLLLEPIGSNDKKKKCESVKGEGSSKSYNRDSTGVLESKPKRKTSFVGVKKVDKKQAACDINERKDKKQKLDPESSGLSNMSGKTKINEGHRETEKSLDLEDKERKQRGNKNVDKNSNDEKNVQNCQIKAIAISKEHNEPFINKKRKAGAKGFVFPVKSKVACKASDRNVPCSPPHTHNDKIKPVKSQIEHDQFVPDLIDEVIEEDISLPCCEMEKAISNDHKSKIVEKNSRKSIYGQGEEEEDDEHLNLSLDSLENECLNVNVTTEFSENGEYDSVKIHKHEHGKFGGHCSEHGSDSDPFEMIED